ncbi:hypothetical protein Gotur_000771 [Gossypium turneri]
MGDYICKIPFLPNGPEDLRIWFHNPQGSYSTKSAYSWMTLKKVGYGPHHFFWYLTWKLQTLPKIKIFYWRLGHDILPTYKNISRIQRDFNSMCPICGIERETLIHALRECPSARAVLRHGGLNQKLLEGTYDRCVDWIEDAARVMDKKAMSGFITTLWNIWNSRNSKVFRNMEEDAKVTWNRAAALNRDFRIFNLLDRSMIPKPMVERDWQKPESGVIKINFDATIHENLVCYGLVARDADGFIHGGCVGMTNKVSSIEWAEIKEGLTLMGHHLKDIQKLTAGFNFFTVKWASRCCNKVADALCKWANLNKSCMDFNMDFPMEIHDLVLNDAIN